MPRLAKKKQTRKIGPVDNATGIVCQGLCIKCGADLRGRTVTQNCHTCGHSIYDSVYGGFLIDLSPDEPRRIHGMSNIVFYPLLLLGALTVLGVGLTLFEFGTHSFAVVVGDIFDVGFAFAMLVPMIALTGVIVFTGRHTVDYYRQKYRNPLYIAAAAGALIVLVVLLGVAAATFGPVANAVIQAAFVGIPTTAFIQRVGDLMRRVPNKKLATQADLLFVITCVLVLAALATLLLRQIPVSDTDPNLRGFIVALTVATDLGALAVGFATVRLLVFARRTLLAITVQESGSTTADAAGKVLAPESPGAEDEPPPDEEPPAPAAKQEPEKKPGMDDDFLKL